VFLVGMAARPSACPSALIGTSQPAPTLKILPPIYMTAKRRQRIELQFSTWKTETLVEHSIPELG
jgi:hypothetical protein